MSGSIGSSTAMEKTPTAMLTTTPTKRRRNAFLFQSYGSGTDIIDEIQFLSRQRSEIFVRKPVLYLAPVDFYSLE